MDSQVVEEIVPLPEALAAIFMVTLQNFNVALGFRVFEGKDSEFLSLRDMLFNLYRSQIEAVSRLYHYSSLIWEFFEFTAAIFDFTHFHSDITLVF